MMPRSWLFGSNICGAKMLSETYASSVAARYHVRQTSQRRKERVMFDPGSGGDPAPTHSERSWPVNEAAALATAAVSAIATPLRSSVRFPATASQVTRARRFLASFLADSPLADDAVLCLSEVATNSVLHSNSHFGGGQFTVSVEVEDQGGPWIERMKPEGQLSLGLRIVGQLTREWGIKDASDSARTVWFEVGSV